MKKFGLFYLLFLLAGFYSYGQQPVCSLVLQGKVTTTDSAKIIADVVAITLPTSQQGAFADSLGNFSIPNICAGKHEVEVSYLGYKHIDTIITMLGNTRLNFQLKPLNNRINTITITGQQVVKDQISTVSKSDISGAVLESTRGLSLGESLKEISGVNSLQTGPSISKPVIDGVYGNRILILNNDVRQEGQNWGNDHAPEIDPFIADKITVIQGAASIRYGSDAIGGVVLLEPRDLPTKPGIDGEINLVGMTNSWMGTASGMLEGAAGKKLKGFSWRIQGTSKKAGNTSAANYVMGNTAYYEDDFSATLNYARSNYGFGLYYSDFSTKIGVAVASHIGTLADLFLAFSEPEPAVKADFSYFIDRPYQQVNHQLFKATGFLNLNKWGKLEGIYTGQIDVRKEYDADVSFNDSIARLNIPDLYFKLITNTAGLVWEHPNIKKKIVGSMGLDFINHGNIQQGTGYQELIPNFLDYGGGVFVIEKFVIGNLTLEGGARYDYRWMRAFTVDPTTLIVKRPTYSWQNSSFTGGAAYSFNKYLSANTNFGTAWRPPQVIELFADGIHQSAASFEHGDSTLTLEKAYNTNLSMKFSDKHFLIQAGIYDNFFYHYIYLKPDAKPVETIQGAFPSFTYTQVNALFRGFNFTGEYDCLKHFSFISKESFVRARNLDAHDWLINVPADRYDNTIKYTIANSGKLKDPYVSINNLIVSSQSRVPPNSDYVPPPPGYLLWGASVGCSIPLGKQWMDVSVSATNLANAAYRDYLDRFRYFIDDPGRNIILRIKIPFEIKSSSDNPAN